MEDPEGRSQRFCVTGATGYLGSWLVKALLQRGYMVHATVRDPAKSLHLLSLWRGGDQLRLFKADLQEEGSFDEAVKGCHGVFHIAASMEFDVLAKENIESYVQSNIIDPAIKGTLNLLKSCLKVKSVKRVVFTSSISTITAKDGAGNWRPVVDESCQTPIDHVWNTKASGWVYVLSKLLTEEAAFQFANENDIDLASVITTTVAGPFLTSTVPSSIRVLLSPITVRSNSLSEPIVDRSAMVVQFGGDNRGFSGRPNHGRSGGRNSLSGHDFWGNRGGGRDSWDGRGGRGSGCASGGRGGLHICTYCDWSLFQLDVKNTFIHCDLEEEVYMEQPHGFVARGRMPIRCVS